MSANSGRRRILQKKRELLRKSAQLALRHQRHDHEKVPAALGPGLARRDRVLAHTPRRFSSFILPTARGDRTDLPRRCCSSGTGTVLEDSTSHSTHIRSCVPLLMGVLPATHPQQVPCRLLPSRGRTAPAHNQYLRPRKAPGRRKSETPRNPDGQVSAECAHSRGSDRRRGVGNIPFRSGDCMSHIFPGYLCGVPTCTRRGTSSGDDPARPSQCRPPSFSGEPIGCQA